MAIIHAIFENGVFKPKEPVPLPEGCLVTLNDLRIVSEPEVTPDFLVDGLARRDGAKSDTNVAINSAGQKSPQ